MKIAIRKVGNDIQTLKDFDDIEGKGEIAHFIAELELIKQELLKLWETKK